MKQTKSNFKRRIELYEKKKEIRTITYLHSLWLKSNIRREKRNKDVSDYIHNVIVKKVKPNENGEYVIYYETNNYTCFYKFQYDKEYQCYSYSTNTLNTNTRQGKIISIVKGELFEFGEQFHYLSKKLETYNYSIVFSKLWEKIQDELRRQYNPIKRFREEIIRLEISGKYYLIKAEEKQRCWIEFKWMGEDTIQNITLK